MKKYLKIIGFSSLMILSSYCVANEKTTLLLSQINGGYSIDFLNTKGVTAIQFDVMLNVQNLEKTSSTSCVANLPKTHKGMCKFKKDKLRVVVYSTSNEVLESGRIGEIKLKGKSNMRISVKDAEFVLPDASTIKGDVMVDSNNSLNKPSIVNKK